MMRIILWGAFLLCFCLKPSISTAQNEEYSLGAMAWDFDRDFFNWNPLKDAVHFPSGISFTYSRQITKFISYSVPINIGKESNLLNSDGISENLSLLSGDLTIKLEQLGSWQTISPFLVGGIGVYGLNENGEGLNFHLKVPLGIGLNVKLYKRLFLRLNTTYNREIYRNRGYYVYNLGLNVKLGKNPTRKKMDQILEPILIGAVDAQSFPDADQDGVPDSLDQCPLVAGIQANDGCPLLAESEESDADKITIAKDQQIIGDSVLQGIVTIEDDNMPTSHNAVERIDSVQGEDNLRPPEASGKDMNVVNIEKSDKLDVTTDDIEVTQLDMEEKGADELIVLKDEGENKEISRLEVEEQQQLEVADEAIKKQKTSDQPFVKMPVSPKLIRDTFFIHDTVQAIKYITFNDRDGDGIQDDIDQCPDEMGELKYHGCKKPKTAVPLHENNEWNQVDHSVNKKELDHNNHSQSKYDFTMLKFPTGIAALQYAHIPELQKIISELKRYSNYHLNIYGYTDNEGSEKLNHKLSNRRALACYQYLKLFNIPVENMSYQGMGEMYPIDDNATYSGRGNNRRVVFKLERNPGN